MVQAVASGCLPDVAGGRRAVVASVEQEVFEPTDSGAWDTAIKGFDELVEASGEL